VKPLYPVTWSHHWAVAGLPPDEQAFWLGRVEALGLSVRKLRSCLSTWEFP
jgi:hypothetical protein